MRWTIKPKPEPSKFEHLRKALNVSASIATLLLQRGIESYTDAKRFFRPSLKQLHDPFLMKDMDKAVARIEKALANAEPIMVFGDYDVDGTSAVALMASYLRTRTNAVVTYIPDRYDEGYGISIKGIDFAHDQGVSLIIALDCGIKAIDKVAYAQKKGIDFIICDHHRPGPELPKALAVLDPKRDDCSYPYDELCGCGVGFKLIQALAHREGKTIADLTVYLDLVAIAIGADIVPVTGENRVLAFFGLQVINNNPRAGIQAIIEQSKKTTLTMTDIVFMIAPRINAAGRMKHGNHAVDLLTESDNENAMALALQIEQFNSDRKEADQQITEEALLQIEANNEQNRFTSVVYHESWHKGVIGIVASRLIETHYKPTLVFTKSGDRLAASARSIPGFDIYNALAACSMHIEQFGGHKYAAGLTLKPENYEAFKQAFEEVVSRTIDKASLEPEIKVDLSIELNEILPVKSNQNPNTLPAFYRILKQFEPFGPGNMPPIFMTKNLQDTGYGKCVGKDDKHLRVFVKQNNSDSIVGIGFNLGEKFDLIAQNKPFDAVYSLDENHWQDTVSLQLKLKDIKG